MQRPGIVRSLEYNEALLTRPRRTGKLAYLKPSFMVSAWVMIVCWAYLEPLAKTRTDKLLVPSNYLFCGWMCLHSCVTSLIPFFSFHIKRKTRKFRMFSEEMEYTRAQWTRYSGPMAKAKGEHNS